MEIPGEKTKFDTPARRAAAVVSRERYPEGKALARIRYFDLQRGLPPPRTQDGRIESGDSMRRGRASRRPKAKAVRTPYVRAMRLKERLAPAFAKALHLPVWRGLGPNLIPHGQTYGDGGNNAPPVSGRCVGMVVDPTDRRRLVLCSAGGGLWGSNDSGATWRPLTDGQPTLSMGAIAAAPGSPNIVYAGTGEGDTRSALGVGLLRSSDGGQTWELTGSAALSGKGIFDIAVDPADPLHVLVGTTHGLLDSRNGGGSFRAFDTGETWDISINPARPSEIFCGSQGGLLRSANGGTGWSAVALPAAPGRFARIEVRHAPTDPNVVYVAAADGRRAHFWRRAAAQGAFASEQPPGGMKVSQAWYDWCFAVSPADPNLVFWGAIELYRGRRGGNGWQWENISSRASGDSIHPDQHDLSFDPSDAHTLYVCNDGGLFRSPDDGTRWEALSPGLGITEFEFLAQLDSDAAWLIGGTQDNGTLSCAGGTTWEQAALGDGGDCGAVDGGEPVCFHSYYDMWIERAPAKGPNAFKWEDASPPAPENYPALFYPPMDASGSVLAKAGSTVFVSEDAGAAWSEVALPGSGSANPDVASALTIASERILFVGTAGGAIYRITRAAGGWAGARVDTLGRPRSDLQAYISDIVVPGSPAKTLWASSSAIGGGHVFRSLNGGRSWSNRTGNLGDLPVNALVVDPRNSSRVFAATDNGVYRSTNSGTAWTDYSNGLPNAVVGDLIFHEPSRTLRAGTRNRGAWEVAI